MTIQAPEALAEDAAGILAMETGSIAQIIEDGQSAVAVWIKEKDFKPGGQFALAEALRATFPGAVFGEPTIETEESRDWLAKWKESFTPLPVGEKLAVIPSWWTGETPSGRLKIILDPGMAFGTGHHATTAGCMAMLEKHAKGRVLDVGCGSGILSIAAALLGADSVVGIDKDPEVIHIAIENVQINGAADKVFIAEGIMDSVEGSFDVIVANLFLDPIIKLAPDFPSRLIPGGVLIISGLKTEQKTAALKALLGAGFALINETENDGWVALALTLRG